MFEKVIAMCFYLVNWLCSFPAEVWLRVVICGVILAFLSGVMRGFGKFTIFLGVVMMIFQYVQVWI